ncbi:MAG: NAD(P)/FAD-dependent oxidoreductase [Candidatus Sericytochromatia bacterium]|nr:MAG: NAD(P)/FAD-dependent oxidoreductase [Candidatus Sericytochromatia bacterium]
MNKVIKIAGAGISGLSSAIFLKKFGFLPEIYEIKSSVGYRFKGDFQGFENWSSDKDIIDILKDLELDINFNFIPSYTFKVCSPKRNLKTFESKERPFYYLIQRGFKEGYLDYSLYKQVENLNIPVYFNCKNLPKDIKIFATGPNKASAIILGINFDTDYKDINLMICDNNIAPKGYAYLLIVNGKGTIATAFKKNNNNPNVYLENSIELCKSLFNLKIYNQVKFGSFGSFSDENIFEKDNKLYIGEAAGLQDFLFGFGLRYAILSGYLAARSICENTSYTNLAKKMFSNSIKASLVNRFLYERLDNSKYEFLINKLSYQKDLIHFLRKRYKFNLKRRILYPIAKKILL